MNYIQSSVTVDNNVYEQSCNRPELREYSRRSFARGDHRGAVDRHQISPYFAQFKIESACAQTRASGSCVYISQQRMHLSRLENYGSRSRLELHKFPAVSGERWWDISGKTVVEMERGRIDTSEIYFWGKEKSGKLLRD